MLMLSQSAQCLLHVDRIAAKLDLQGTLLLPAFLYMLQCAHAARHAVTVC